MSRRKTAGDSEQQLTERDRWMAMVDGLCRSCAWPPGEGPIERVQTHISVVLLGRRLVLKMKKPVDLGFLDYTTREKRRRSCEAEVRLNRRLCRDLYIRVQPIREVGGEPHITGADTGRILDYGVLMRRLPAEGMLDHLVAQNAVSEQMIDRIARRLSAFHRHACRGPEVDAFGSEETIAANWEENFAQAAPFIGRTIGREEFDFLAEWARSWMAGQRDLLRSRVQKGRIRDGHGDLRCESICIGPLPGEPAPGGIRIFDCIEFNDRFRCGDVAGEAAFLAMDLDAHGRGDLGYYFAERYAAYAQDDDLFPLLPFYRCYRAYVRGKVSSFCLDAPEFSPAEREAAAGSAKRYFELARRYASPLASPAVVAVMGLSGTGKTSIARAIAGELGLRVVSSDIVRREIFGDSDSGSGGRDAPAAAAPYGTGRYSPEAKRQTYDVMLERGRELLCRDGGVLLDATFQRKEDRDRAQATAEASGAQFRLIECRSSPERVRERLEQRAAAAATAGAAGGYGHSEADWETYLRQREAFDPVREAHCACLRLDNDTGLSATAQAAADWLRRQCGRSGGEEQNLSTDRCAFPHSAPQ